MVIRESLVRQNEDQIRMFNYKSYDFCIVLLEIFNSGWKIKLEFILFYQGSGCQLVYVLMSGFKVLEIFNIYIQFINL